MRSAWSNVVRVRVGGAVVAAALAVALIAPRSAMAVGNACLPNPCASGGDTGAACALVSGVPGYKCSCSAGYAPSGSTCIRVNPCVPNHCLDGGDKGSGVKCTPTGTTYTCSCDPGYTFSGGTCAVNLCARTPNPCQSGGDSGAVCHTSGASYSCSCDVGYSFMGGTCLKPPPK